MSDDKVAETRERKKKPYLPPQVVTRPAARARVLLACSGQGVQCTAEPGECCVPNIALCEDPEPPCS